MSARWYKRCGADFIHGTMTLSLEEKGAYSLCLDLIYDRGGPIPDDARWISGVCGVSLRKWGAIRDRLISLGKIIIVEGLLSNSRADFEILSADLSSRERAESGAKGGRKRAENEAAIKETNDLGQAELKPIEKIREENKEGSVAKATSPRPWALPVGVSLQVWTDLLTNRRRKRLPNTDTAWAKFLRDLEEMSALTGIPPPKLIEQCTAKGWGAIYDPREQRNERSSSPIAEAVQRLSASHRVG